MGNTLIDTLSSIERAGGQSEAIRDVRPIELNGELDAGLDLSGVAVAGDFLILGGDLGHRLQILRRKPEGGWSLQQGLILAEQDQDTDIESIAVGPDCLYVVGSHSHRRRRMRPELSVRKNRQRLYEIVSEPSRNRLYRLPFDSETGKCGKAVHIDLSKRLRKDPLLGPFLGIPRRENGLDIQGMSFHDNRLYLGFRGPVLREKYVPLMVFEFDRPKKYELCFVRLGGQGIRDMVPLRNGFLILSGPVMGATEPFCLWCWDGADQLPGKGRDVREAVMLGTVSTPGGAKAEGLGLLRETDGVAEAVVVYETNTAAQTVSMRVTLPD